MTPVCYIFGAMPVERMPQIPRDAYVIAADGGYRSLAQAGITPDLVIGDFDSAPRPDGDNVSVFPKRKDDTDMMLAVKEGLMRGYRRFYLYGGVGGRLDHTLANIGALAFLRERGATAFLCGDRETLTLLYAGDRMTLPESTGKTVSLFACSEAATVGLTGLLYAGDAITLKNSFPLGVSNETVGEAAEIAVTAGSVLAVFEGDAEKFSFPS